MERKQATQVGDMMTLPAAAQALGLTYWQVRRIVTQHRVPTTRIGNTLLVRLSDIEAVR
jgi:hypothetical protein